MSKVKEHLEELATQVLLDNDMLDKVPINIIEIAKAYGIDVYTAEFENEVSGVIRYDDNTKKFEIIVNKNNSETRRRFTIAHELGHYFLHKDMLMSNDIHIDTLYRLTSKADEQTKKQEQEVDYFAGALLMNRMVLESLIYSHTIEELSEIFKVSSSAMTVRLDVLGLL